MALLEQITLFFTNHVWLLNIVQALLILLAGLLVIKLLLGLVNKAAAQSSIDQIVLSYMKICLKTVLYILLIIIILSKLGISVVSLVAVLSAAFAAVALALKDSLSNLASGLLIIVNKPFDKGDYIENGALAGVVDEIHLFNCRLHTLDNKYIMVPNNTLLNGAITNYSFAEERRVDVTVQVGYETDLARAKAVLLELAAARPEILPDPPPFTAVSGHGDAAIELILRVWCKNADYWTVYYYLLEEIILRFRQEGINIPYPQLDVHMLKGE